MEQKSSIDDYNMMHSIGSGATSEVFYAIHKRLNAPVAIKVIPKSSLIESREKERFEREVYFLQQFDHEYISSLYDVFADQEYYFFVMDFAENGSLQSIIGTDKPLQVDRAKKIFAELLSALSYIHNVHHVLHRDIKADNVLLDKNYNTKLVDFGFSNIVDPNSLKRQTQVGSPAYISPEIIRNEAIGYKSDIWSTGILLFYMITGKLPYEDSNIMRLFKRIATEDPVYPDNMDPMLIDLLQNILNKDPDQRFSITEIMDHPWMEEYKSVVRIYQPEDFNKPVSDEPEAVIDEMKHYGVKPCDLREMLNNHINNKYTAMYKILKRRRASSQFKPKIVVKTYKLLNIRSAAPQFQKLVNEIAVTSRNQPAHAPIKKQSTFMKLKSVVPSALARKSNIMVVPKILPELKAST